MDQEQIRELRELIEFLKANDIAEFDMELGEMKVRLKFAGAAAAAGSPIDLSQLSRLLAAAPQTSGLPAALSATPAAELAEAATAEVQAVAAEEALHILKSPIVGTFYESPSPGAPVFVKPGDMVEVGQVLCIIEAMKLMNEIECDVAGEIVRRIASSGQPVEYGQPLFAIRQR